MKQYKLSSHINPDKVFIINRSELEGRLDSDYHKTSTKITVEKIRAKKYKKLRHIIEPVKNGSTPYGGKFESSGVKYYRSQDFSMYEFNIKQFITKEFNQTIIRSYVKQNDILLAVVGATLGQVGFVHNSNLEGNINQNVARLRIKDEAFSPEYVAIYLKSYLGQLYIKRLATITTQAYLNNEQINQIEVPHISKSKQKQIVDLYQKAYRQKQQKEAEAKALLNSIDSYLLDELGITLPEKDNSLQSRVFTTQLKDIAGGRFDPRYYSLFFMRLYEFSGCKYEIKDIKDISWKINSGSTPKADGDSYTSAELGVPFIRITNLKNNTIDFFGCVYITKMIHEKQLKRTQLKENDVLISMAGTIGLSVVVPKIVDANINQAIARIELKRNISPIYISEIINSQIGKIQTDRLSRPSVQMNINFDEIKSIKIPLPPLEKQNEIAQHIQSVREQAKKLQNDAKAILEQAKKEVEKMILG